jgi:predicted transcriptional regulator
VLLHEPELHIHSGLSIVPKISVPEIAQTLSITRQAVHKRLKEKGIEARLSSRIKYLTHKGARDLFNHPFSNQVFAIQIVKGGTGKTTIPSP